MISVISKHLPLLTIVPSADTILLKNIHLVELIRYHRDRLKEVSDNEISVPSGFQSGLDIKIDETQHLYRFMCLWFELENFVKAGKSFLDFFWKSIISQHKDLKNSDELRNGKYLSQAMNKLRKKQDCNFKNSLTYKMLEKQWDLWGAYLICFRNYLEYGEPLGGMLSWKAVSSITQNGKHIDITVADDFPRHGENPDKYSFAFTKNITALDFANSVILGIDTMFPEIIKDIRRNE